MSSASQQPANPDFRAVADASALRTVVSTARSLVTECRLELGADGLSLTAMDPATVAAVRLRLDAAAFEHYAGDAGTIGVNLERLADLLSLADTDELVSLALDAERGLLHVDLADLHYTLALVDPDSIRQPPNPDQLQVEHAGAVTADAAELTRIVRAADMVSDHVDLALDETDPVFRASADGDTDAATIELDTEDLHDATPGDALSTFSLSYLDSIEGAIPTNTPVTLSLGTELPATLDYEVAAGHGTVEFFLSPRIKRN